MLRLDPVLDTVLDGRTKGIPATATPFRLRDVARQGWNVLREDLPLPLMVIRRTALDNNIAVFGDYLETHNLSLAPHGKTTMAPQIFEEQLDHGAWGITAATAGQVQVMHHYGVRRVILANQLIGRANIAAIAKLLNTDPDFDFYTYVDSIDQLSHLDHHLSMLGTDRPLKLLIEVGVAGGRTGLRGIGQALAVADALSMADPARFRFAGVAAFEGVVPDAADNPSAVAHYAQSVVDVARALPPALTAGLDEFVLTGGGSSFFDLVADAFKLHGLGVPVRIVLRSGCYVTNDSGSYRAAQRAAAADPKRSWSGELRPALEAWAYVQSRPEPDLAFVTMGKRDVPYDAGLPIPFRLYRPGTGFIGVGECEVFATNDQHTYVRLGEGADWQVGDMVASGISHPCTAFDKWRFLPVVDDEYNVIDGVLTYF
ncbi:MULTISPECIES: amino acid deaminase [unclassified Roseitalea]|uniref:amino acid deaminase n=1 Tax=unclassified Roseitalea TaxID=2639107 RepID=UPI00273D3072|nr:MULTISPECIES: amino acid deaminase [unclassified Roseitalea]